MCRVWGTGGQGDRGAWGEVGDSAARLGVLLAAAAIDPDLSVGDINQAIAVRNGITQSVMVLNNEDASPEQQQEAAEYLVVNMLPWDTENPDAVALRDIMAQSLGELMVTDPARGEEALELLGQFVRDMNTPQEDLVFVAIPPAAQALLVLLGVGGTAAVVATDTGQELASSAIDGVAQGIGNTYTGIAGWIGGPQTEEQVFGRTLSDAEIYARLQPGEAYQREDGRILAITEDGYAWDTHIGNNQLDNFRLVAPEQLGGTTLTFPIAEPVPPLPGYEGTEPEAWHTGGVQAHEQDWRDTVLITPNDGPRGAWSTYGDQTVDPELLATTMLSESDASDGLAPANDLVDPSRPAWNNAVSGVDGDFGYLPTLRQNYVREVYDLQQFVDVFRATGASLEDVARYAHSAREGLKIKYREYTSPEVLEIINARNVERYGNNLGPTFDYLIKQGKSFEQIIESATRSGGGDLF